jgi:hypothetical protein
MAYIGNTAETQGFIPAVDFFSGNGSTTAFTLSRPVASVAQVQATIENVPQNPGTAFTVSGNTITFDGAPASGTNNIYVYYTSPITQVIQPGQGTVSPSSLSTGGPVWDTSGNLLVGTTTTGSTGITLSATYNLGWGQGAGQSVPNIFRQTSSAATVLANGYRNSATPNGFASSFSSSYAKSAISCGTVAGGITFYTDTAAAVAAGTDVTPTERMRIASNGAVTIRNNIASNNALELGNTNTGTGTSFGVKFAGGTNASDYCISGDNAASTVNLFNFRGNGDFQFNSGYGSAATAYGCRAWVNFNGTGTIAIRASGNVSSISDFGTGNYGVNYTTAMPNANYSITAGFQVTQDTPQVLQTREYFTNYCTLIISQPGIANYDSAFVSVAIHR